MGQVAGCSEHGNETSLFRKMLGISMLGEELLSVKVRVGTPENAELSVPKENQTLPSLGCSLDIVLHCKPTVQASVARL
jgi:hypothetical protein